MLKPALAATLLASAAVADTPVLTVYTYDSFVADYGTGPKIEPLFEAECGCDLNIVAAGDGASLLARLRLEGAHSDADVVLGLDTNLTAEAVEAGLMARHGLAPERFDLPVAWDDPYFLPYDWGWFALVYDKTRLPNPPASFAELLDAPENVSLILLDPRSSTPGLGMLLWVKSLYGDEAAAVWEKLSPRIVTVAKGWWEGYSAFLEGESTMALSYTTSPAYHQIVEEDDSKAAAIFAEGHYAQVEVGGVLNTAEDKVLARKFLDFMISAKFQNEVPTTNWMYPAVIPESGLPDAMDALPRPQATLLFSPEEAAALRAGAIEEWRGALSR